MHVAELPTELVVVEPSTLGRVVELLQPDDFEQPIPLVLETGVHVSYAHRVFHYEGGGNYRLEGWFECDGIPRQCRLRQSPDGSLTLQYHELFPE
jgi:hypothetical protein